MTFYSKIAILESRIRFLTFCRIKKTRLMVAELKHEGMGKVLLFDLAEELGEPQNSGRAARVLNSVLYAVTNMLEFNASIAFLREVPLYAKGVHQWGWQVGRNQAEHAQTVADLRQELININHAYAHRDFPTEESTAVALKAVFRALRKHVKDERWPYLKAQLPEDLASFLEQRAIS